MRSFSRFLSAGLTLPHAKAETAEHETNVPGFRAAYGPRFDVGYLRDPQGNKIALFSSNPDEPGRDG
jgi:hypothetical protein